MAARSLAHRFHVDGHEVAGGGVAHRTRGIVERSGHGTDEGQHHIVGHHIHVAGNGFGLLHAEHGLETDHVGPGFGKAGRLRAAVEIDQQVVGRRNPGGPGHEFDHLLVVAVQHVHHESLDAQFGVIITDLLDIAAERPEAGPEQDADMLFAGVFDHAAQVQPLNHLVEVGLLARRPPFSQNHILEAVFRRKINVVFVGLRIDARPEIHAVEQARTPPVPQCAARQHPAEVHVGIRSRCKLVNQVVVGHLGVVGRDGEDAPRELGHGTGSVVFRDKLFAGGDDRLQIITAALRRCGGIGRELAGENPLFLVGILQIHTGIVVQVRLGDADADTAVGLHQHGQIGHAVHGPGRDELVLVSAFERVVILLVEGLLVVRHVTRRPGHEGGPVTGEMVVSLLGNHFEGIGLEGREAIRKTVIVGPENHLVFLVGQANLVELSVHFALGVIVGPQGFVDRGHHDILVDGTALAVETLAALDFHRDRAIFHQKFIVVAQREDQTATVGDLGAEPAVRRGKNLLARRCRQRKDQQQRGKSSKYRFQMFPKKSHS